MRESSPNGHAHPCPAHPTGETIPNCLHSPPPAQTDGNDSPKSLHSATPTAAKQRNLPQTATLSRPQRSQPEKPHPDRYAGNCPARIETGQSSAAQAHNPQTHITPQPSRSQMKTVSPDRPRLTVPVLFHPHLSPPVSSPSPFFSRPVSPPTALAFPQRSQTAKPSPNSYAQPPPP